MEINLNSPFWRYNQLYKEENDLYHDLTIRLGLSDSAFSILYTICYLGGGCTQKEVCSCAFLSKQTVNSSVRKLEEQEILYLEKGQRRDTHLYLTEKGKALAEEKIKPVIDMELAAFSSLGEDSLTLVRLNAQYLSALRREFENQKR